MLRCFDKNWLNPVCRKSRMRFSGNAETRRVSSGCLPSPRGSENQNEIRERGRHDYV